MGEKTKLFLVLCLHRSGSSATAGVLHLLGIHMGDKLLPASPSNEKGHFENSEFVKLNDEILRNAKGSWNHPPSRERIAASRFPAAPIQAFIENNKKAIWGLKDPRTLLTFEIWKPYLEEAADITYVFVHRPFEASVSSLTSRDRISTGHALSILTPYLKNLYHYRHNYGIPASRIIDVNFQDIVRNPEPFVREINTNIGMPTDYQLNEVKQFLDLSLKKF
ncbi:sulfotransferase family protein [Bacillus rubiinfantis]|uniref:sulfotransferase family protein n=1 Tax=Bacillus rubiinfantis TaxID=1499680 RepID=UPI0005AA7237|nr:sulfotransferase [Bacillus rubiinfantis]